MKTKNKILKKIKLLFAFLCIFCSAGLLTSCGPYTSDFKSTYVTFDKVFGKEDRLLK